MEQSISGKTKPGESPGGIVATPGDNVDLDMRGATTETPDEDMADKSSSSGESSDCDSLPDLAGIEARHLRRASNHDAKTVERQGLVYTDMYRQLQLKPQKYLEFYNGVLWPLRYNHLEEIQRGTPAGYKAFTNRLLRGYGYIIWPDGPSEWLMDEADLDEGEVRLKYVKPSGRAGASTVPENARYVLAFRYIFSATFLTPQTDSAPSSTLSGRGCGTQFSLDAHKPPLLPIDESEDASEGTATKEAQKPIKDLLPSTTTTKATRTTTAPPYLLQLPSSVRVADHSKESLIYKQEWPKSVPPVGTQC